MAEAPRDIVIASLAGGQNDTDHPIELDDDQVVLAENIEFFFSALGERRNGCSPLDLFGSGLQSETLIAYLTQWFPTNDVLDPQFFAVAASPSVSTSTVARRTAGVWSAIVQFDPIVVTVPKIYELSTQALNGKLFVAYPSAVDSLHVWDNSSLRRTGYGPSAPAAPTGQDLVGIGDYVNTRYFRVRFITRSGSTVTRRSEPSLVLTWVPTPAGMPSGVRLTRGAALNLGETDWELEASVDNAFFYRIATVAMATTFYDDRTNYVTGYAPLGPLSEAIGTYAGIWSARFLAVDGDRLVFGGHFTDATKQSMVGWTPVANDPGAGNDERLPSGINNTKNLDNYDGGPLTGLSAGTNGTWYAFKAKRIYKFTRTGDVTNAYSVLTLSSTRGAILGSLVRGVDENGAGCLYFLDPSMGPSRLGPGGLEVMVGLRTTWGRVNLRAANLVARGVYYADKQQVHWWLAVDGQDQPSMQIVLQVSELRAQHLAGGNGVGRGWSIATGQIGQALCAAVLTEIVTIDGVAQVSDRPFVGMLSPFGIQRCDTWDTDGGIPYRAILRTKPFLAAGLLNKWGAMCVALLATAHASASVVVKLIRDFGVETFSVTTPLAADALETDVIKQFDNLVMSEATVIQVEISDP